MLNKKRKKIEVESEKLNVILNIQIDSLRDFYNIMDLDDFTDKELRNISVIVHNATNELEKLNKAIYECAKRNKDAGNDIAERAERRKIGKNLLMKG